MISEFKNDSDELELFMNNDEYIYLNKLVPVMKKLGRDHQSQLYNKNRAIRMFYKVARVGRMSYNSQFGRTGFNEACLTRVAESIEASAYQELELGKWGTMKLDPVKIEAARKSNEDFHQLLRSIRKEERQKKIDKIMQKMRKYPQQPLTYQGRISN